MTTTIRRQNWLTRFLCDELDAANAWYGRSEDTLEGSRSFSSISSQLQKSRFSDNGSVLHITNQRGGSQTTTLTFVSAKSPNAWLHDEQVRIIVKFTRSTLERFKKTHGNEIFDVQAGTILELRDFSVVVDPHGIADENLRLLITDCVTARPTSGAGFINPDLQRVDEVSSVQKRLTSLLKARQSPSSSQNAISRRSTPTVSKAIQLDDSSGPDVAEVESPLINTQVQLASQMPTRRPVREKPGFTIASGANLSRPIEARRSVATTKAVPANLLSLVGRIQPGFTKSLLTSTTDQPAAGTHDHIQSALGPRLGRHSGVDTNEQAHPDDINVVDVMVQEQDVPTYQRPTAVDLQSSTKKNQLDRSVQVKQEEFEDMHGGETGTTPNNVESHSQLSKDDATSEGMVVENFGDGTTTVTKEQSETRIEDGDFSARSHSVGHSLPQDTALGIDSSAKLLTPSESAGDTGPRLSCLHENNFHALQQLIRTIENMDISQEQMKILNKPESWQYPAPPMRLPQPNIPITLLKEFKQCNRANAAEAKEGDLPVAEGVVDIKNTGSTDDAAMEVSDDEEAVYSGWDASSSPDRVRQIQEHMQAPSSPAGPPAGILLGQGRSTDRQTLPPDSSVALLSDDDLDEDSPPPAHADTAAPRDPRLALAQFEPHTVPERGSQSMHLSFGVDSNVKHAQMLSGSVRDSPRSHLDSATLNIMEDESSDIEMGVPQALPLPLSQLSHSRLQPSPTSRSNLSRHSHSPSSPRSAYQTSPYQLVPGSFNSTQVERYHTMQMPIIGVDGAAESKPIQTQTSPISITPGQRTVLPQSTSPISAGTKRSAPDSSMPSHQLPAQKKRREQSFDWDRQSQVEDPIELSRRMRREFLNQRKTTREDSEVSTRLMETSPFVTKSVSKDRKTSANVPATVPPVLPVSMDDNDEIMSDVHQQRIKDQDDQDGILMPIAISTSTIDTSIRPPAAMPTMIRDDTAQHRIYTAFRAAYPSYTGDSKHFANLCRMIHKLTQGQRMLHRSLWDDFIIRHKTDYPAYLMQCAEEGMSVKTYDAYYQDDIEEPLHTRKIVTPVTLEAILSPPGSDMPQEHSVTSVSSITLRSVTDIPQLIPMATPTSRRTSRSAEVAPTKASPQNLSRMGPNSAQKGTAVSAAIQSSPNAGESVQSPAASSTPRARTSNMSRQHGNSNTDKMKSIASTQPPSSSASRAQDLLFRKDRHGGASVDMNSPTSSAPARSAAVAEISSYRTLQPGATTRVPPLPRIKQTQKETTNQRDDTRDDPFFTNVPTGPKASITSSSRVNTGNAPIPGLNLLNPSNHVQGKAPLIPTRHIENRRVEANGHPRSVQDSNLRVPPPGPLPPVTQQTGGLQNTRKRRGPYLHTAASNAPKRRDAAHDPAADPTVTGQGKISEAQEEADNRSQASGREPMGLQRVSELGDVKINESARQSWDDEHTPFTDFARNFLGARAYPYMLGTASANSFQVSKIKTRSTGKGLDLLAWRL